MKSSIRSVIRAAQFAVAADIVPSIVGTIGRKIGAVKKFGLFVSAGKFGTVGPRIDADKKRTIPLRRGMISSPRCAETRRAEVI